MDSKEFTFFRKKLNRTQEKMAHLLGVSVKAVHSYEQNWRSIPVHVERQMLFLIARLQAKTQRLRPCWVIKKCPPKIKKQCPAWEFRAGTLCCFINGTICQGQVQKNWKEKMKICRSCEVMTSWLPMPGQDVKSTAV